jgi:hypothetical protein
MRMRWSFERYWRRGLVLLLCMGLVLTACSGRWATGVQQQQPSGGVGPGGDEQAWSRSADSSLGDVEPAPGVELTVASTPVKPAAGEVTLFTVTILPREEITGASLEVTLPPGFEWVSGDLTWQGDLRLGQPVSLSFQARPVAEPEGTVEALLLTPPGVEHRAEIAFGSAALAPPARDLTRGYPVMEPLAPQGIDVAPPPAGQEAEPQSDVEGDASQEAALGTLYLSGRFLYSENLTTSRGAWYAHVEAFDHDSGSADDYICSATTDANGYWSCSGSASDPFDDTVEVYAVVWARNSNFGNIRDGSDNEYAFRTSYVDADEDGDTVDFGSWWPPGPPSQSYDWDGAWHIHKMVGYGYVTCRDGGGETPPGSGHSHYLYGRWPDPDADNSSEYGGWTIKIEGPGSTDPDEWDESVILHEYGHYLMDHFATNPPFNYCNDPGEVPPCSHSFGSHEDPQTAYLEGWANYYQSATKRHWGMANAHLYQETTWSANLETDWHSTAGTWDDCEGAVAGILWDINDVPDDDQDTDGVGDILTMYHDDIHDTFSFYDPPGSHTNPWTIHEFWDGFTGLHTTEEDEVRRIYWEHGIDKDTQPNTPYSPSPTDGSSGIRLARDLDWYCTDPDGDALTYDVYFEKNDSTPDVRVASGLGSSYYDPGALDPNTHYYWKVVAEDLYGKTRTGPVWDFTTTSNSLPVLGVVMPEDSFASVGVTKYFSTTCWDMDGWQDLKQCYFHIGANPSIVGNVTLLYNRHSNKMWIRSDDGLRWLGGYAPGTKTVLENGQAKVYCLFSSTYGRRVTLTVHWAIEFKKGFTGEKKLGIKCKDMHGAKATAEWKGVVTIQ